ncbi:MAG: hypothetical protein KKH98_09820, partial [Spirochaetes bacterium]|nr:hypothetical protein [Spirochaetota bacterium]
MSMELNSGSLTYDQMEVEVVQGTLRLSTTGYWTNTGILTNYYIPNFLHQDKQGNLFYVAGQPGPDGSIYKSTNYGEDWYLVQNVHAGGYLLEASDGNLYLGDQCCSGGNWKSIDGGETWFGCGGGGSSSSRVFEDKNKILYYWSYGCIPCRSRLYRSTNYATNWSLVTLMSDLSPNPVTKPYLAGIDMLETSSGYFLAAYNETTAYPGIFISSNKGTNWRLASGTSNQKYYQFAPLSDGTILACGEDGTVRSTDQGLTWSSISGEPCRGMIETSEGILVRNSMSNVWKSYDKGNTWIKTLQLLKGSTNFGIYQGRALLKADNRLLYAGGAFSWDQGYVFKSQYVSSSTAVYIFSPKYVVQYQSLSKNVRLNNGAVIYEFSYSQDKGITWSGWAEATDANLNNVKCLANGDDRLKVRMTLNSYNNSQTPEVNSLSLVYDDGS